MKYLEKPNLPKGEVTHAVVSAALPPGMRAALAQRGVCCLSLPPCTSLAQPVSAHPDMSLFYTGNGELIVCPELYPAASALSAPRLILGQTPLSDKYPTDVAYDALSLGGLLLCAEKHTDPAVLLSAQERGMKLVNVRQGYAKCSVCVVAEKAAITEDAGIAATLRANGVETLLIPCGGVRLDGYDCGFIGGASGLISPSLLAFCGNIAAHSEYEQIREFCAAFGVELLSLSSEPLTDFGSILPLKSANG